MQQDSPFFGPSVHCPFAALDWHFFEVVDSELSELSSFESSESSESELEEPELDCPESDLSSSDEQATTEVAITRRAASEVKRRMFIMVPSG